MSDTPKRRGVGGRAGTLPVKAPPLPPAKPARKTWEYTTFACEGPISDVLLDEFGKDGWELVGIYVRFDTVHTVFKREAA